MSVGFVGLLAIASAFVGLAVVVAACLLWLSGRDEPPRRED
jgi:hypothetical protein